MASEQFGPGHGKLHLLRDILLFPAWYLLPATRRRALEGGSLGEEFSAFFPFLDFETLHFPKPSLPAAACTLAWPGCSLVLERGRDALGRVAVEQRQGAAGGSSREASAAW